MNDEEKLVWLREHQPRNQVAIRAIEVKLGLLLSVAPKKRLNPRRRAAFNRWQAQISKENKMIRGLRVFLPGHEPDR